ncbi:cytochrome P450, partial [Aureobasidium melanogenum]
MFDHFRFILLATSAPLLVNLAFRHPYSWLHAMLLAICFAVSSSIAAMTYAMFIQSFFFSSLRNLPTATQKPIWTRLFKEPTSRDLARFHEQSSTSQLIRYFGLLNSERVLLMDPKDIKQVMDSEAYEFGCSYLIRRLLSPVLGKNSLVVTDGPDHMRYRKIQNARLLVEDITTNSTGTNGQTLGPDNAIEVLKWLEKATFRIVFIAFFGSTTTDDHSSIQDLLQEFQDAFAITSGLSAQAEMALETILPSHLFFTLLPVNDVRKTKRSMRGIKGYCRRQIAQRRSQYTPASRLLPDKNILDTAIKSEDLSDAEILDLCTTFLATGYKTVSAALAWAIYHLSTRPGVQALLRTEIRANFPALDQTATMAHRGNDISAWDPTPFTHAPNANVSNAQTMTSPEAVAAREKAAAVMAALKKGEQGDADRLMGKQEKYDSLVPGMAKLKNKFLGGKKDTNGV